MYNFLVKKVVPFVDVNKLVFGNQLVIHKEDNQDGVTGIQFTFPLKTKKDKIYETVFRSLDVRQ